MKIKICFCFIAMAIALACHKDEPNPESPKGILTLNVGLFITVTDEENNLKSTAAAEDFAVTIFNQVGVQVLAFDRASDVPDEIELDAGNYYVTAHSNNNLPAAFDNPYYYGESAMFTIVSGGQQTVTVNCQLANTMITIVYSDNVKNSYSDYYTTVSTSAGSLVFAGSEIRAGYFQPLPITISVVLTRQNGDGTTNSRTLTGTIPNPQPRKHYEIHVDASIGGLAALQINLDEGVDPVEIVNITDNQTPVEGVFAAGDLLITEIMYDPSALEDTEGEWFEIYNNTSEAVDLGEVVIRKNGVVEHVITGSVLLGAHEYLVMARTETSCTGNKYVYGTSLSLNNTGALLSLYNYGTDGNNGTEISSVNYGASGFPEGIGASIGLSPALLNPNDAANGSSWCTSVTAFNTGDLGTPNTQNDSCLK